MSGAAGRSNPCGTFPGYGELAPLDLPADTSQETLNHISRRITSRTFYDWSEAAARVGHCAKPIRLRGTSTRYDTATGEALSTYSSADQPLGVTYVRCGNRRENQCPSCSRIYARDTFELIRAGVTGGKTVPASVGDNPLVFATLTAPSFGHVHGTRTNGGKCRPRDKAARCEHGVSLACFASHTSDDPVIGSPICSECYDYDTHLVWQWWAPELWRRFTIALRRLIARHVGVTDSRLNDVATVQYAKVGEQQQRAVIHFHALVRLDGPKSIDGYGPAPATLDAAVLACFLQSAASTVSFTAPPISDGDVPRILRFGVQVDARPVTARKRDVLDTDILCAEQVAGYLAKYATKTATASPGQQASAHLVKLRQTARELADCADPTGDYGLMGKWVHMLGFRGHFSSKSRRYSVTLGQLRRARQRFQSLAAQAARDGAPLDVAGLEARLIGDDNDEITLVVGQWSYAGSGWDNDGDTALALAAAARAREYDQWRAQSAKAIHNQKGV